MSQYLIKIRDRYFEWSTVSDAPITHGMTEAELHQHIRQRDGEAGIRELPARLKRVEAQGTSSLLAHTLADLLENNRAGEDETHLSADEIYAAYAATQPSPSPFFGRGERAGVRG